MRLKRILNSVNYQNLTNKRSDTLHQTIWERFARYARGVLYALKGKPSRGECDFANCLTLVDVPTKNRFEVFMDKVLTDVSCSVDRRNGVLRFAAERGAEYGEVFMEGQPYSETIGKYLAEHPDCDGIVCFNDYIAMEAQYLLRNCGRADVRVVGYDDIIQEFKLPGAYATVGTDKQKLAKTAIRLLMERINGAYEKESRKGCGKERKTPLRNGEIYQSFSL